MLCVSPQMKTAPKAVDRVMFRRVLDEAIQYKREVLCYARLMSKPGTLAGAGVSATTEGTLFEVKGHPHFIPGQDDCKYLYLMAKPYPSRNIELCALSPPPQIDLTCINEYNRLTTFLDLKMENEALQRRLMDLQAASALTSVPNLAYTNPSTSNLPQPVVSGSSQDVTYYPVYEDAQPVCTHPPPFEGGREEEGSEDGSRRKKVRRFKGVFVWGCD
jgi:hypothetical protein